MEDGASAVSCGGGAGVDSGEVLGEFAEGFFEEADIFFEDGGFCFVFLGEDEDEGD